MTEESQQSGTSENESEPGSQEIPSRQINQVKPKAKGLVNQPRFDAGGAAWYVVYTIGQEDKIKQQILKRAENMGVKEQIKEVFVPKKTVTKVKGGKRVEKNIAHYQRYVFVNMVMNDDTFRAVRNTPGVLNIIDRPLSQIEVARLFGRKRKVFDSELTQFMVDFEEGDEVKIIGGAFDGFIGFASSIDLDQGKVTVMISVFGRQTPVDLTVDQVHPVRNS